MCCLPTAGAADAADDDSQPSFERPAYRFLRFQEDWSGLGDVSADDRTDFFDPIKYVPMNRSHSDWASFGGSTRGRVEDWRGFAFDPTPDGADTFLLWRARLHADLHFGRRVRTFFEVKTALSTDRSLLGGERGLDVDKIDLQQAFADFAIVPQGGTTLRLRLGRQMYLLGKQRLVSPLPWANTLRAWDGVTAIVESGKWKIDGFYSYFVPVRKSQFNTPDNDQRLFGAYATTPLSGISAGVDLYLLGFQNGNTVNFNGTMGTENRHTLGGRFSGKILGDAFDYDLELAYQSGSVGEGDISAFMVGAQAGCGFAETWSRPRVFVGFDFGSGDREAGGDVQTFNQLYPLGHAYLGFADVIGRQNIIDPNLGVTFRPLSRMRFLLAGHFFWRHEEADALYNPIGGVVRPGSPGSDRKVGQEVDLTFNYRFSRHLDALVGYSRFLAGSFIEQSGTSSNIDFAYVQAQYVF